MDPELATAAVRKNVADRKPIFAVPETTISLGYDTKPVKTGIRFVEKELLLLVELNNHRN